MWTILIILVLSYLIAMGLTGKYRNLYLAEIKFREEQKEDYEDLIAELEKQLLDEQE